MRHEPRMVGVMLVALLAAACTTVGGFAILGQSSLGSAATAVWTSRDGWTWVHHDLKPRGDLSARATVLRDVVVVFSADAEDQGLVVWTVPFEDGEARL